MRFETTIVSFRVKAAVRSLCQILGLRDPYTIATEFAARTRGTAMSLVTFAFMVGGAAGTQIGGQIAAAASFQSMYALFGGGLLVLALVALPALRSADSKTPAIMAQRA